MSSPQLFSFSRVWREVFTTIMRCLRKRIIKDGGVWFSLLTNKSIFDSKKRKIIYGSFDCEYIASDLFLILVLTYD